jgi:hypothetical protein
VDKSGVRHHKKGVMFLGYKIYGDYGHNVKWKKDKDLKTQRVGDVVLKMAIPLEKLYQRFTDRGFFQRVKNRKTEKYVGRRLDKWLFLNSEYDIILRFNSVIRGIQYYYSGSTYRSVLDRFWSDLKRSAALTIAHKNNKRNASWAFSKFGKELYVKNPKNGKVTSFLMPTVGEHKFRNGELNYMLCTPTGIPIPKTLNPVCSASDLECAIPNCVNRASQWHHIRHRKNIRSSENKRAITAFYAKQIPLCLKHHTLVHSGKYDGPSLRKLKGYTPSDFD